MYIYRSDSNISRIHILVLSFHVFHFVSLYHFVSLAATICCGSFREVNNVVKLQLKSRLFKRWYIHNNNFTYCINCHINTNVHYRDWQQQFEHTLTWLALVSRLATSATKRLGTLRVLRTCEKSWIIFTSESVRQSRIRLATDYFFPSCRNPFVSIQLPFPERLLTGL